MDLKHLLLLLMSLIVFTIHHHQFMIALLVDAKQKRNASGIEPFAF